MATLTTKVNTAKSNEDDRQYRVGLQISCSQGEGDFVPYSIEAELVGFFEVDANIPQEKIGDIVSVNAPAVLYSAARELVLLVTGRGPFPPFLLPCSTFTDDAPSNRKQVPKTVAETA